MRIMFCMTIVVLILCSYTTLTTAELSQTTLQQYISAGYPSHSKGKVNITATDRNPSESTVITVTDVYIQSKDAEISLQDPAPVKKPVANESTVLIEDISLEILIASAAECASVHLAIINNGAQN
jgi:hypothetical protein